MILEDMRRELWELYEKAKKGKNTSDEPCYWNDLLITELYYMDRPLEARRLCNGWVTTVRSKGLALRNWPVSFVVAIERAHLEDKLNALERICREAPMDEEGWREYSLKFNDALYCYHNICKQISDVETYRFLQCTCMTTPGIIKRGEK